MAEALLVTAFLPAATLIPEDGVQNNFVFAPDGLDDDHLGDCFQAVMEFYNALQPTHGFAVSHYINQAMSRALGVVELKAYDLAGHLDGSARGGPIATANNTLDASGAAGYMPRQLAVCLSFHGDYTGLVETIPGGGAGPAGDTHPKARRRGRLFIGPLDLNGVNTGDANGSVQTNMRDTLTDAATALANEDGNITGDPVRWCVWSRAEANLFPVVGGWVDNKVDTQRRRGVAASIRTPWSA